MMAEVRMANSRFIGGRGWSAGQIASGAICGMLYLYFLSMVIQNSEVIEVSYLFMTMLGMMMLVLPIVLHGVIAGEREKRSLEMLLAAPVTSRQIAMAKLMRSALFVAVVGVAFLLPILTVLVVQTTKGHVQGFDDMTNGYLASLASLFVILLASLANASISLAISATAKSTSAAMIANVGVHFFLLGFVPLLLSPIWMVAPDIAAHISCAHPFWTLMAFLPMSGQSTLNVSGLTAILIGTVVWSAITIICFMYVVSSLDGERRLGGRRRGAKES
jgi:ABC-type transport system involved in multi-copper enzyme maturation permease subunit